ncbi:hypothetical protein BDF14DRAFT_1879425 [Spinellus fusiger]|nr:hypothetical protein BDF14DRAFT_1879425 [Spinellus fusiger]
MKRPFRLLLLCAFVLIGLSFVCLGWLPAARPSSLHPPTVVYDTSQETYLSYFPHGGFIEQHEAFRNAIRIALETNRTIIAPALRLGKTHPWAPFGVLAKRYQAQDKQQLHSLCTDPEATHWRLQLEPCKTLNDWTEIPWSTLFDIELLYQHFGIRVVERDGHGWGREESALGGHVSASEIAIVDTMTFSTNGTALEHTETVKPRWIFSWRHSGEEAQANGSKDREAMFTLTKPLSRVFRSYQLAALQHQRLVQFGSLAFSMRYETTTNQQQAALRYGLSSHVFVRPDRLSVLKETAHAIVMRMGGANRFSVLHINLSHLAATESQYADDLKKKGYSTVIEQEEKEREEGKSLFHLLSEEKKKEMMAAVVLQVSGEIPIDQAISAAMPLESSQLLTLLQQKHLHGIVGSRKEWLEACVDYHRIIDSRYPVYYLVNDGMHEPNTHPDFLKPLTDTFPCTFSKSDMLRMGIINTTWTHRQPGWLDTVDYEDLLGPVVDILIAGKAYSFFEAPQTPLTRLVLWQQ